MSAFILSIHITLGLSFSFLLILLPVAKAEALLGHRSTSMQSTSAKHNYGFCLSNSALMILMFLLFFSCCYSAILRVMFLLFLILFSLLLFLLFFRRPACCLLDAAVLVNFPVPVLFVLIVVLQTLRWLNHGFNILYEENTGWSSVFLKVTVWCGFWIETNIGLGYLHCVAARIPHLEANRQRCADY